jgi:hypothetical protein
MKLIGGCVLATAVAACGPGNRPATTDGHHGGDGNNQGGDGGDDCSDSAKLVYVVDQNNTLSQFDPATRTFHDLGALNCPDPLGMPFSMGVDRTATAYVLYTDGEMFKVDTTSLACSATPWSSQLGLLQFGMGFSTDQSGGSTDTLFIAGGSTYPANPTTLATIDVNTFTATQVGTVDGWPELTGTGSAELWGFFPDPSSPRVEKLNKASGASMKTYPEASLAGTPTAWAFAFWGGDYWIFLASDISPFTSVYQIDGMNGHIKSTTSTTRTIVGAGVSTCAPIVIQ